MSLPSLQSAVLPRTATSASFTSFRSGRRLQLSCVRSDHFSGIECFVAACESQHRQATHLTDLQWGIQAVGMAVPMALRGELHHSVCGHPARAPQAAAQPLHDASVSWRSHERRARSESKLASTSGPVCCSSAPQRPVHSNTARGSGTCKAAAVEAEPAQADASAASAETFPRGTHWQVCQAHFPSIKDFACHEKAHELRSCCNNCKSVPTLTASHTFLALAGAQVRRHLPVISRAHHKRSAADRRRSSPIEGGGGQCHG